MKFWQVCALAIVLCCSGAVGIVHGGEVGELDATFGDDGKVVTSFDDFGDQAFAVAIQPDGKILAAGSASNGYDYDIAIARYTKDGKLDPSFSDDGKLRVSLGPGDEELAAIAVQEDGYIVGGGYTVLDGNRDFVLVRFTPSGEFDNSFGKGGVVATGFGNLDDEITALTIDDEGRIVACGYVTGTAGVVVAVARYGEDGEPDNDFGDAGSVLTDVGGNALVRSIEIDGNGRLVLTGSYFHADRTEMMVLRYYDNGALDPGFGQDGIAVPADRETPSEGFGVGVAENGTILVAGTVGEPGSLDSAIFRFDSTGQPDVAFGDNGVLITSSSDEDDMALAIDVLGNVVGLSGFSTFNTKRDFLFVSLEEEGDEGASVALNDEKDGFPETGNRYANVFDLKGQETGSEENAPTQKSVFSTTYFGYTDDVSYAVALQDDGKAISVGYTERDGVTSFAIARYVAPLANTATGSGLDPATVSWVMTKEPSNVDKTSAFTGGTILDVGVTVAKRGVVYSIAPDPIYTGASEATPTPEPTTATTNIFTGSTDTTSATAKRTFAPVTKTPVVNSQVLEEDVSKITTESDTASLQVSKGSPRGEIAAGSTMTYIGVYTNEAAICRYSLQAIQDFDAIGDEMASADNLSHIARVRGLEDEKTYTYYVRCRDFDGNENGKDYVISFSVAAADTYELEPYRRFSRALNNFLFAPAYAQDAGTDTPASSGSVFTTGSSYEDGGYTENGSGVGSYSAILKNLKPGTFYYVRAYAVDSNGKVYYGNQVGFETSDSCFIATAAYGTLLHPYVKVLRSFRDRYMLGNIVGKTLVNLYYHYSPPAADYIAARPYVRGVARVVLLPVIGTSWLLLNIGFAGLVLLAICIILPFTLMYRSYRRLEVY